MFKQTTLITFRTEADEDARGRLQVSLAGLVCAEFSFVGTALPGSHRGGDLVWHLHFADESAWRTSGGWEALDTVLSDPAVQELDAAAYSVGQFGIRDPMLRQGVYRTLFVGVSEATPQTIQTQFSGELACLPNYIPEIRNWAMNATVAARGEVPWTHVWEQEFASVDGLVGPYMMGPYHWAFVDRWFDDEMPEQIVANGALRHSVSTLVESVINRYGM